MDSSVLSSRARSKAERIFLCTTSLPDLEKELRLAQLGLLLQIKTCLTTQHQAKPKDLKQRTRKFVLAGTCEAAAYWDLPTLALRHYGIVAPPLQIVVKAQISPHGRVRKSPRGAMWCDTVIRWSKRPSINQ